MLEGRYGACARNCDGFGAGTAVARPPLMQWLLLASHYGSLSTRGITGLFPSPAIYLHRVDSRAQVEDKRAMPRGSLQYR